MAGINVKVPTKKVIAAVEKRIADIQKRLDAHEQYEKDFEAWKNSLTQLFDASTWKGNKPELTREWVRNGGCVYAVQVTYNLPKDVLAKRPKQPKEVKYDERTALPELESALRLLNMTDEEFVSATTFKQISRYL